MFKNVLKLRIVVFYSSKLINVFLSTLLLFQIIPLISNNVTPVHAGEYAFVAEDNSNMDALLLENGLQSPLYFTRNEGQEDSVVKFTLKGSTNTAWFLDSEVRFTLSDNEGSASFAVTFPGSNAVTPVGNNQVTNDLNCFTGNVAGDWITGISGYTSLTYTDLWDGIDLTYTSINGQLQYEFTIDPHVDPSIIQLAYDGVNTITVLSDESLSLDTLLGTVTDDVPLIWNELGGSKIFVDGSWAVNDMVAHYSLGTYDESLTLVIDPTLNLEFATFLGGSSGDSGEDITIDSSDSIYVTGYTNSSDYPTTVGTYDRSNNGSTDIFISKFSSDGSTLIFSSFVGGNDMDSAYAIEVDSSNNIYVAGLTYSTNIPITAGAFDSTINIREGYILKLDSTGSSISWASYLGGSLGNMIYDMNIDSANNIYVTGYTSSNDFPITAGSYQTVSGGDDNDTDVFVSKISSAGALEYSTYIGGGGVERGYGIEVDTLGSAYVTGYAQSGFPSTAGSYDESNNGNTDIFVLKLSPDGSSLDWSTFVGGSGNDTGKSIALDSDDNVYITGYTGSSNYPITVGTYDETPNGENDVIVSKISADGTTLDWSTYIGGPGNDSGRAITVDSSNIVYVAGYAEDGFPTTAGASDDTYNGGSQDMFLSTFSADGSSLTWSSYLGGDGADYANSLVLDTSDNVLLIGYAIDLSLLFDGYDPTYNGGGDGFIAKFSVLPPDPNVITSAPSIVNILASGTGEDIETTGIYSDNVVLNVETLGGGQIAAVNIDMTSSRDWSGITAEYNPESNMSLFHYDDGTQCGGTGCTFSDIPGAVGTDYTLKIPRNPRRDVGVCIVPGLSTLSGLNGITDEASCITNSGIYLTEGTTGQYTVTKTNRYWAVAGVTGTGGVSIHGVIDLSDTLTRLKGGEASNHLLEFGTINGLTGSDNTFDITFDSAGQNFDLSNLIVNDIDLEDDGIDVPICVSSTATCSATTDNWGVNINSTTDKITFTAPTSTNYIDGGSSIYVEIGTNATYQTTGANQIINPTAGEYEINFIITNTLTETGEVTVYIVDDDTVNVTGYLDTFLLFDVDTAFTDTDCTVNQCDSHSSATDDIGYVIDLGELSTNSVNKSGDGVLHADGLTGNINYVWFDVESNASGGVVVTVLSANGGLTDGTSTIPSVTSSGTPQAITAGSGLYGIRSIGNTTTGGSFSVTADYADASNYGELLTSAKALFSSSAPVDGGRLQFGLAASPDSLDETGTYTDQLTFVATATF